MKHSRFAIWTALVLLLGGLAGCGTGKNATDGSTAKKDPALLIFPGKDTVYKSEFEYVYQKNNGGWDAAKAHTTGQYQEYLDLYINFKRKVLAAEDKGLHETEAFKSEFEGYRKQLAQPYLVEKSVQERLIREAYDRGQEVISASHLLILAGPDASPADTLKAFNLAKAYRDSVVSGKLTFEEAASKYSQDPSAKSNEGNLGFFSVFDMVYPFESGAYNTKVGEVSQPVRSGYGYHLIKVHERVANSGKKAAAHIIIRVGPQYSAKTEEQAKEKINEIYQKLKGGADWNETARAYSDDPNTANSGGDLGKGRLIPEMEDIKRKLGEGEISEPFTTSFGHHIMRVTEVEPTKSFEDSKAELKARISRDARSTLSREMLIKRIKKDYNLQVHNENFEQFHEKLRTHNQTPQYIRGFWKNVDTLYADIYEVPVFTIGKGSDAYTGTMKDYFEHYTKARKGYEGVTLEQATDKFVENYINDQMLAYEERQLPKKYIDYRELLKEYRDGILLFTLTEEKVWRKAVEDTTGLKQYYEDNKSNFMANERVVVTEYISEKPAVMEQVARLIQKNYSESDIDSIANETSALNLRVRTQTYEKGKAEKEAMMFGMEPGQASEILDYGKAKRILVLKEKLPAGQKSFDDAKSEAITQYQNYLETEWLKELKDRYDVKVQEKVFENLFK